MEEFITQAASQLGIDEATSRSATGSILGLVKGKLGAGDFSELLNKLPGADKLVSGAAESAPQSGGGLGGMLGKAASMFGGEKAGNVAGLLGGSGLSLDKAGPFVAKLAKFLKDKLGGDLFEKVKTALPDLTPGE